MDTENEKSKIDWTKYRIELVTKKDGSRVARVVPKEKIMVPEGFNPHYSQAA